MEDRKRPSGDDSAPPAKRQAVTVNGAKAHQDADLPWKDDIETYQKDAILRQMREYKREKNLLEIQIADMEKRSKHHDEHLRIIDTWFDQMLDDIKVLVTETVGPSQNGSAPTVPPGLLGGESDVFKKHLSGRTEKIQSALGALFAKFASTSPEVVQLQHQLSSLLAKEKEHICEIQRITTEKDQMTDRIDVATHRYMIAEKKMDRLKSQQVQKLEKQAIASAPPEEPSSANNGAEPATVNGVVNGVINEELETARNEAVAEATKRKEHLEQLEAENKKLTEQVTLLNVKLAGLSDDDYAKTDLFKAIKTQHEDVMKRINHLEATNIQLREEAQKYQAERTAYRIQVDEESRGTVSESESNLAQSEANLARIRNSRDELLAKVAILEATQNDNKGSKEQMQELAKAQETRIAALESEVKRLRMPQTQEGGEGQHVPELDSLSVDQLHSKIKTLESQYKLLSDELPAMEAAWKKAQTVAGKKITEIATWEDQIAKANGEKVRADQKYFAAMKSKESKDLEVRQLRGQASKSTEIVAQLKEADSISRSLVDKHEKQLAEMKLQLDELSGQHRTLQQKLNEATNTSESQAKQIVELKKLLETKDSTTLEATKARREAETERVKLKTQVEGLEKQVDHWKAKSFGNQSDDTAMMRSMLQCQVCKNNFKNTAIKTCGHVFCDECVSERIQSRSRKCPNCSRAFGSNDTMRVHI